MRPVAEHVHRANADIPEDVITGLAEIGGFGLSVPEEYGGFAAGGEHDYLGMVVATEELSWGSLGVGGSLITRPEILTRAIVQGGTEEQKQRWLPGIASGELMVGVMVTEPDYGSDVAAHQGHGDADRRRLPPQRREDVGDVRGPGRRAHAPRPHRPRPRRPATAGSRCSWSRRSPPPGHAFAFAAARRRARSRAAPSTRSATGACTPTRSRSTTGSCPPRTSSAGSRARASGFYLQMEGFENGRLQTAARAVGLMQAAFEAGLSYAQERRVFGQSVFDYQLSQAKLARMAALIQAGRQFAYDVARRMAKGEGALAGVDGEGVRVSGVGVGDARGDAAPRRHGVRGGVPGVALLRRRARAVDLRGRRRDALPARDRPPPRRAGARASWASEQSPDQGDGIVEYRLEMLVVPVSDVDRCQGVLRASGLQRRRRSSTQRELPRRAADPAGLAVAPSRSGSGWAPRCRRDRRRAFTSSSPTSRPRTTSSPGAGFPSARSSTSARVVRSRDRIPERADYGSFTSIQRSRRQRLARPGSASRASATRAPRVGSRAALLGRSRRSVRSRTPRGGPGRWLRDARVSR